MSIVAATGNSALEPKVLDFIRMVEKFVELSALIGKGSTILPSAADSDTGGKIMTMDELESTLEGFEPEFGIDTEQLEDSEFTTITGLNLHESDDSEGCDSLKCEEGPELIGSGATQLVGEGCDSIVDLMVQLTEVLFSLKEIFSKSSRADQEVLANQIPSLPLALEGLYALLFNLFECE